MASSLSLLKSYNSGTSDEEEDNEVDKSTTSSNDNDILNRQNEHNDSLNFKTSINPELSLVSKITVDSAPLVLYSVRKNLLNKFNIQELFCLFNFRKNKMNTSM